MFLRINSSHSGPMTYWSLAIFITSTIFHFPALIWSQFCKKTFHASTCSQYAANDSAIHTGHCKTDWIWRWLKMCIGQWWMILSSSDFTGWWVIRCFFLTNWCTSCWWTEIICVQTLWNSFYKLKKYRNVNKKASWTKTYMYCLLKFIIVLCRYSNDQDRFCIPLKSCNVLVFWEFITYISELSLSEYDVWGSPYLH